ncbi:DUF262 domain-containing protein [Stigmatella aurantiaca]|nr:DUF262 domain-containing protein [Stigmatella aurantiaca]
MVETLLEHVKDGKIRVPDFQRPLKWRSAHVLDLFDSVYRGFPVGDLLLFKGPAEPSTIHFGPLRIGAPHMADAYFVVDGQQRVTALAGAMLHPDSSPRGDIHAIWFDLEVERFERLQVSEPPPHWIPVNVVGDSFVLLNWLNAWPFRSSRPDLVQRAIALGKALREYQIPAYIVEGAEQDVLRLIFKRVNTSGVAMQESEVFEALFAGREPRPIESACGRLQAETGFGKISHDWFLRCLKVVEGLDLRQTFTRREGDAGSGHPEAVEHTEHALRLAIGFLSEDAGIFHSQLLPYRLPLVVLARFFHLHPRPNPRTRALLVRWVWRGALSRVHTLSSDANVHHLQSQIDSNEFDSVERLLSTVAPLSVEEFPSAAVSWSSGRNAETRLCAIALAHLGPREPKAGEVLRFDQIRSLLDKKEASRVFLPCIAGRESLACRFILPDRKMFPLLVEASEEVLHSHALDDRAVNALKGKNFEVFERRRSEILNDWFVRFFLARTALGESDRPPVFELVRRVDVRMAQS